MNWDPRYPTPVLESKPKIDRRRRRSNTESCVDILRNCVKPSLVTYAAQVCNMNWYNFKKKSDMLVSRGLLEKSNDGARCIFTTTPKGREAISLSIRLGFLLGEDRDDLSPH